MKKRKIVCCYLVVLMLLMSLIGCGNQGSSQTSEEAGNNNSAAQESSGSNESDQAEGTDEKIVVGVSQCTTQEERWRNDSNALQALADEMGIELKMVDATNDVSAQATQIENLISSGIDVLLVSPTDSDAIAPSLEEAKKAGVPVVVWGRQANTDCQDFFIINDFVMTGREMAKIALEVCSEGNIVLIGGDKSSTVPTEMTEGMMSALQEKLDSGEMTIVFEQYITNWAPDGAMSAMENALTQLNNDVDLVLCHNDGMAGGAIQALDGQGLAGQIPVVGMDAELAALQRIAEDKQYSTVIFDHSGTASICLNAAAALAKGEDISSLKTKDTEINGSQIPTADIPVIIITKDNMDSVCIDSGIHTREEIYK